MDDLIKKVKLIATHDQTFHADDVFAIATLKQLFPDATIIRTRDKQKLAECDLLVDIGGEYDDSKLHYDHHQKKLRRYARKRYFKKWFWLNLEALW